MIALTRALGIVLLTLAVASAAPGRASEEQPVQKTVVIRKGDTLAKLAARHAVKLEDLRRWNRGKVGKKDAIKAGQQLVIQPGRVPVDAAKEATAKAASKSDQVTKANSKKAVPPAGPPPGMWEDQVVVKRGDSLSRIGGRAGVELGSLMTWNGLNERSKIKAGQRLRVFRPGPRPPPQSVGRPTAGSMSYGQHLGTGPGYRLRFPRNAYGVDGVLKTLKVCAKRVRDNLPGSHDLLVGDISRPGGGRFPPHEGHQSGRDVDVGYYLASLQQPVTMHRVRPDEVDYPRTWALLKCYLTTDKVSRVYMDRGIQTSMAEWLRTKRIVDEGELQRIFEVVGGEESLILHAKRHDTHIHVRFACDAGQVECLEEDGTEPYDY